MVSYFPTNIEENRSVLDKSCLPSPHPIRNPGNSPTEQFPWSAIYSTVDLQANPRTAGWGSRASTPLVWLLVSRAELRWPWPTFSTHGTAPWQIPRSCLPLPYTWHKIVAASWYIFLASKTNDSSWDLDQKPWPFTRNFSWVQFQNGKPHCPQNSQEKMDSNKERKKKTFIQKLHCFCSLHRTFCQTSMHICVLPCPYPSCRWVLMIKPVLVPASEFSSICTWKKIYIATANFCARNTFQHSNSELRFFCESLRSFESCAAQLGKHFYIRPVCEDDSWRDYLCH